MPSGPPLPDSQPYLGKHGDPVTQCLGRQIGMVPANDPRLFEGADATQARRRRNAGTPSQFDIGDTPLGLQTLAGFDGR